MNMAHAQHCSGRGVELGLIVESALHGSQCSDCQLPLALSSALDVQATLRAAQ
jgi:hypothetical protein